MDKLISGKGDPDWPDVVEDTTARQVLDWAAEDPIARSISIAFRYDGDPGIAVVLPLLLVRSINDPLTGGWLTNRLYVRGLRDGSTATLGGRRTDFLSVLTDFWGVRVGVKSDGLFEFSRIGYVVEVGARAF